MAGLNRQFFRLGWGARAQQPGPGPVLEQLAVDMQDNTPLLSLNDLDITAFHRYAIKHFTEGIVPNATDVFGNPLLGGEQDVPAYLNIDGLLWLPLAALADSGDDNALWMRTSDSLGGIAASVEIDFLRAFTGVPESATLLMLLILAVCLGLAMRDRGKRLIVTRSLATEFAWV